MRTKIRAVVTSGLAIASTAVIIASSVPLAQAATTLSAEVKAFRVEAISELRGHEAQLAPGLNAAEKKRVHTLLETANRRLGSLVFATARLDKATGSKRAALKSSTIKTYDVARKDADVAIEEIQPLAMRTMGVFDMIRAKNGIDNLMARFDAIGAKIRNS